MLHKTMTTLLVAFVVPLTGAFDNEQYCMASQGGSCAQGHSLIQGFSGISKKMPGPKSSMPQEGDEEMAEARPHIELVDEHVDEHVDEAWWGRRRKSGGESKKDGKGKRKGKLMDKLKGKGKGKLMDKLKGKGDGEGKGKLMGKLKEKLPVGGAADHMIKDLIEKKGLSGPGKKVMDKLKSIPLPTDPKKIIDKLKEIVPAPFTKMVFPNGGENMMTEIKKILKKTDPPPVLVEMAEGQDAAPAEKAKAAAAAAADFLKVGGPKDLAIKELIMKRLEPPDGKAMMDKLKNLPLPTDPAKIEEKIEKALPLKEVEKVLPPKAKKAVKEQIGGVLKKFGGFR